MVPPAAALASTSAASLHAHLVPEGVDGFVSVTPLPRVHEVRPTNCFRNGHAQYLIPGRGDFDFPGLFRSLETRGYTGHYIT